MTTIEDNRLSSIQLDEEETERYEEGDQDTRAEVDGEAVRVSRATGTMCEIYSDDGIVLDAIYYEED
jgi:hypothetical protein